MEHERRLAQAQDGLVAGFVARHPASGAAAPVTPAAPAAPPTLRVVEPREQPATRPAPPPPPSAIPRAMPVWGLLLLPALMLALTAVTVAVILAGLPLV